MLVNDNIVLYFDGVCNLCNGFVQFFLKRDKRRQLKFASLQSKSGAVAQKEAEMTLGKKADTVILHYNGKYYIKSTAALYALASLGGFWRASKLGLLVPRFIRDMVYDWIAKHRYKWFGRQETCMVPTPEIKGRFLED